MIIVFIVSGLGLATQDVLFTALGADSTLLPVIASCDENLVFGAALSHCADDHQWRF